MEDIARASRKAKSTLYYYFRSKEEVFAAVIQQEISGLKAALLQAIERESDPYARFRAFVKTRLGYLNERADRYTTIRDEHLKHYEFIRALTEDYSAWEMETIQTIVKDGRDQGAFRVTDAHATSRALFIALKGLEYPWILNLTRAEAERSVDVLIDILLAGICVG
jgi:AcrR family transcriptional regulator